MDNIIGRRVEWAEEDGKVATGFIASAKVQHHEWLGMDLTHVEINWDDNHEVTQHTLEAMLKDPRVKVGH